MTQTRRALISTLSLLPFAAFAQNKIGVQQAVPAGATKPKFSPDFVVKMAEKISKQPFVAGKPQNSSLNFDQYRDIRFKGEKALLDKSNFRLHMFHTGFIHKDPVRINLIKEGVVQSVSYNANQFNFGKANVANGAYAGFRLHYPLNDPAKFDELVSFLGASYFRFLGRGQAYGLSARGVAINSGEKTPEEFPIFKEFWIENPTSHMVVIHALMDSPSLSAAFRFSFFPAENSVVEVEATLFTRAKIEKLGLAPLTSMFMKAENDKRVQGDFRPELHDSDGLMVHGATGEWLWRPLKNPENPSISVFLDKNVKGFGLLQRDRLFEHYQDLDLNYENRPSYWIEPIEGFGEGRVELVELPTSDETNDNIVAYFVRGTPIEADQRLVLKYRMSSLKNESALHKGARAINTYKTKAVALGGNEATKLRTTRFIVDFAGGDLEYFLKSPHLVQIVPTVNDGQILRTFIVPNPAIKGFRAAIDVQAANDKTANIRAFLKSGEGALSETWTYLYAGD